MPLKYVNRWCYETRESVLWPACVCVCVCVVVCLCVCVSKRENIDQMEKKMQYVKNVIRQVVVKAEKG